MKVGWHFLEESYNGPTLPVATFLDNNEWGEKRGSGVGLNSPERLVRLYTKGDFSPSDIARKASSWSDRGCRVQVANEPNLPSEFNGGPDEFAKLYIEAVALTPSHVRLYYPGIAPTGYWQAWYDFGSVREAINKSHGISVHAYGDLRQLKDDVWQVYKRFPTKPLWISEFNFGAGLNKDINAWAEWDMFEFLKWANTIPTIEALTYFAYKWPHPDMWLPTSIDGANTQVESLLLNSEF